MKGILSGDPKVLASVSKSLSEAARATYDATKEHPFLVVRAAGSLGADLVALRHDVSFLMEVKSSKHDVFYFTDSPRLVEQLVVIRDQCERSGVLPIYAYRLKSVRGDAWRFFSLPGMNLAGQAAKLYGEIPKLETTASGSAVLRWNRGMELGRFLSFSRPANGHAVPLRPAVAPVPAG